MAIATFDVKNAFLNDELEEKVYMDPPTRNNAGAHLPKQGIHINEGIIWVKTVTRPWFGHFTSTMT